MPPIPTVLIPFSQLYTYAWFGDEHCAVAHPVVSQHFSDTTARDEADNWWVQWRLLAMRAKGYDMRADLSFHVNQVTAIVGRGRRRQIG
jgi:hypothetical protein